MYQCAVCKNKNEEGGDCCGVAMENQKKELIKNILFIFILNIIISNLFFSLMIHYVLAMDIFSVIIVSIWIFLALPSIIVSMAFLEKGRKKLSLFIPAIFLFFILLIPFIIMSVYCISIEGCGFEVMMFTVIFGSMLLAIFIPQFFLVLLFWWLDRIDEKKKSIALKIIVVLAILGVLLILLRIYTEYKMEIRRDKIEAERQTQHQQLIEKKAKIIKDIEKKYNKNFDTLGEVEGESIIILKEIVPDTNFSSQTVYSLNINTLDLKKLKINEITKGERDIGFQKLSRDGEWLAWIPLQINERIVQKIYISDVVKDIYELKVQLSGRENLNFGYDTGPSAPFDARWVGKYGFVYEFIDEDSNPSININERIQRGLIDLEIK